MKRFKKLTIYILVGVLLSSSVLMSYKKAEVVQASATLTLGTGALLMLGILGAYGIVYKGAVDSATGEYIWKGDRGAYPHEVEEAEEWFSRMYDNAVRNWCAQNGKDPDDWDGDDDGDGDDMDEIIEQPPLWNTLVGSSVANNQEMMKRAIKLVGAFGVICADVVNEIKDNMKKGEFFDETMSDDIYNSVSDILLEYPYTCVIRHTAWSEDKYMIYFFKNPIALYLVPERWGMYYAPNTYTEWKVRYENGSIAGSSSQAGSGLFGDSDYDIVGGSVPVISSPTDDYKYYYPIPVNNATTGVSTNVNYDDNNKISAPVVPQFYFPSADKIESLLDGLENSTGDDTGTQNAVDTFVDSLGQTETDTEPDTGGNEGTGTNPDTGGQGGTGGDDEGNEDEENGMFLADLKNVFPFCIPFDLIDCFRLFNAEPETPRVEVPLHFGIVEKDYTFVIDLKDFDGVAEICRSMFLILYIVGLVMATRPLIRG